MRARTRSRRVLPARRRVSPRARTDFAGRGAVACSPRARVGIGSPRASRPPCPTPRAAGSGCTTGARRSRRTTRSAAGSRAARTCADGSGSATGSGRRAARRQPRVAGLAGLAGLGNRPRGGVVRRAERAPRRCLHAAHRPRARRGRARLPLPRDARGGLSHLFRPAGLPSDARRPALVGRKARDHRRLGAATGGRRAPADRARRRHAHRRRPHEVPRGPAQARPLRRRRRDLRGHLLPVPRRRIRRQAPPRRRDERHQLRRAPPRRDRDGPAAGRSSGRHGRRARCLRDPGGRRSRRSARRRAPLPRNRRAPLPPHRTGAGVTRSLLALVLVVSAACAGGATRSSPAPSTTATATATPGSQIDVTDMMGAFPAATFFVVGPRGVAAPALLNPPPTYTIPTELGDTQVATAPEAGRLYVLDGTDAGARLRWFDITGGTERASRLIPNTKPAPTGIGHGTLAVDRSTGAVFALLREGPLATLEEFDEATLHSVRRVLGDLRCGDRIRRARRPARLARLRGGRPLGGRQTTSREIGAEDAARGIAK